MPVHKTAVLGKTKILQRTLNLPGIWWSTQAWEEEKHPTKRKKTVCLVRRLRFFSSLKSYPSFPSIPLPPLSGVLFVSQPVGLWMSPSTLRVTPSEPVSVKENLPTSERQGKCQFSTFPFVPYICENGHLIFFFCVCVAFIQGEKRYLGQHEFRIDIWVSQVTDVTWKHCLESVLLKQAPFSPPNKPLFESKKSHFYVWDTVPPKDKLYVFPS